LVPGRGRRGVRAWRDGPCVALALRGTPSAHPSEDLGVGARFFASSLLLPGWGGLVTPWRRCLPRGCRGRRGLPSLLRPRCVVRFRRRSGEDRRGGGRCLGFGSGLGWAEEARRRSLRGSVPFGAFLLWGLSVLRANRGEGRTRGPQGLRRRAGHRFFHRHRPLRRRRRRGGRGWRRGRRVCLRRETTAARRGATPARRGATPARRGAIPARRGATPTSEEHGVGARRPLLVGDVLSAGVLLGCLPRGGGRGGGGLLVDASPLARTLRPACALRALGRCRGRGCPLGTDSTSLRGNRRFRCGRPGFRALAEQHGVGSRRLFFRRVLRLP
jgi:hypothetical protein